MGKIVSLVHISLDGYMATSNREMNWVIFDSELNDYVTEIRKNVDAVVYGRVTYQMMESYWPDVLKNPEGQSEDQVNYAKWATEKLKVVVSKTLTHTTWDNTRIVSANVADEITKIKQDIKGDLLLIASGQLTQSLMEMELVDEFRININPIILGSGIALFRDIGKKTKLELLNTIKFKNGVIGVHYKRI